MAPTPPAQTDAGASRRGALARRLVELRETGLGRPVKGLALASAVGTSKHSLWEWEHGRHIPREQALDALARFFARGDPDAAEALRIELLGLRDQALRELQNESARLPPGRRRAAAAATKVRPAHLAPSIRSSSVSTPGSFASNTCRPVTTCLRLLPLATVTHRLAGGTRNPPPSPAERSLRTTTRMIPLAEEGSRRTRWKSTTGESASPWPPDPHGRASPCHSPDSAGRHGTSAAR